MSDDRPDYHRRSIRLRGYDYASPGAYAITIVTQGRACVFGSALRGPVVLNDAGRLVDLVWRSLPAHYPGVSLDLHTVLPNHLHGIIVLGCVGSAAGSAPSSPLSLPAVIQRFKSLTTKAYADAVHDLGWPAFPGRLWQRNYYERVLRDDGEIDRWRRYISENALRWESDPYCLGR